MGTGYDNRVLTAVDVTWYAIACDYDVRPRQILFKRRAHSYYNPRLVELTIHKKLSRYTLFLKPSERTRL